MMNDAKRGNEFPREIKLYSSFDEDFALCEQTADVAHTPRRVSIVTGVAAYPKMLEYATRVEKIRPKMQTKVYKIINNFFGETITVAGLLTGQDIAEQLEGCDLGDVLYIPENALRAGEETFLCGMTVTELSERLGVEVVPVPNDGYELCSLLLEKE